jgi:hypothetical protein
VLEDRVLDGVVVVADDERVDSACERRRVAELVLGDGGLVAELPRALGVVGRE